MAGGGKFAGGGDLTDVLFSGSEENLDPYEKKFYRSENNT